MREQAIARFRGHVTGEACLVQRLTVGFSVGELAESLAGARGNCDAVDRRGLVIGASGREWY